MAGFLILLPSPIRPAAPIFFARREMFFPYPHMVNESVGQINPTWRKGKTNDHTKDSTERYRYRCLVAASYRGSVPPADPGTTRTNRGIQSRDHAEEGARSADRRQPAL